MIESTDFHQTANIILHNMMVHEGRKTISIFAKWLVQHFTKQNY